MDEVFHANISPSNVSASTLKSQLTSRYPNDSQSLSNDGNGAPSARKHHTASLLPRVYALIPKG